MQRYEQMACYFRDINAKIKKYRQGAATVSTGWRKLPRDAGRE